MATAATQAPETAQFMPPAVYPVWVTLSATTPAPTPTITTDYMHPWGNKVVAGTDEFDALYAKANNQYMYHLWYSDKLAPCMATELLKIQPLSLDHVGRLQAILQIVLEDGIDTAMAMQSGIPTTLSRPLPTSGPTSKTTCPSTPVPWMSW